MNPEKFELESALINKLVQTIRTPTHCPIRTIYHWKFAQTPPMKAYYCIF